MSIPDTAETDEGMRLELRCSTKLHAVVLDDFTVEVSCSSRFCGKRAGVVVLHRFNLFTGEMTTRRYKEPPTIKSGG